MTFLECAPKIRRNDANDPGICRLALAHFLFEGVLVPQPTKTNTGSVEFAETRINAPPPKRTKKNRPTSNVLRATFSPTWFTWQGTPTPSSRRRYRQGPCPFSCTEIPCEWNSLDVETKWWGVQWSSEFGGAVGKAQEKLLGKVLWVKRSRTFLMKKNTRLLKRVWKKSNIKVIQILVFWASKMGKLWCVFEERDMTSYPVIQDHNKFFTGCLWFFLQKFACKANWANYPKNQPLDHLSHQWKLEISERNLKKKKMAQLICTL